MPTNTSLVPDPNKIVFIYGLFDPRNNDLRYIGKTQDLKMRMYGHMAKKDKTYKGRWVNSLREKGLKPDMRIIEEVPETEWKRAEAYWIDYYRATGYKLTNTSEGGSGGCTSEESRKKISDALKGRVVSDETKLKQSIQRKGKIISQEQIDKFRITYYKNKPNRPPKIMSESAREKLRQAHLGKKLSPEHVEKLREAGKKRIQTPETKEKLRIIKTGKPCPWTIERNKKGPSEETRKKISETIKLRWAEGKLKGRPPRKKVENAN